MDITTTEWVEANVVKDIVCDCCRASCSQGPCYEFAGLDARWGYYSKRDGEIW